MLGFGFDSFLCLLGFVGFLCFFFLFRGWVGWLFFFLLDLGFVAMRCVCYGVSVHARIFTRRMVTCRCEFQSQLCFYFYLFLWVFEVDQLGF